MCTVLKSCWLFLIAVVLMSYGTDGRRRRKLNEVTVVNKVGRNLKLRCQSLLTDLHDQWLEPEDQFSFSFYDFDRGNLHFWCDAYGLEQFDEHFDVFGETAPSDLNLTWVMHTDGLFKGFANNTPFFPWWSWAAFMQPDLLFSPF